MDWRHSTLPKPSPSSLLCHIIMLGWNTRAFLTKTQVNYISNKVSKCFPVGWSVSVLQPSDAAWTSSHIMNKLADMRVQGLIVVVSLPYLKFPKFLKYYVPACKQINFFQTQQIQLKYIWSRQFITICISLLYIMASSCLHHLKHFKNEKWWY